MLLARNEEALKRLQAEDPDRIRTLAGDLADLALPQQAIDLALKEFGQLDSIVINHGTIEPVARIENSDIQEWKKLFDVNFFSAVAFVRRSALHLAPTLTACRQRLHCRLCVRIKDPSC